MREDSPTEDDIIIKEIDLDVLQPNGLIETLWNQEPEKPTQVWSVEEGHADLLGKSLQQWDQHSSRVLPAWETRAVSHTGYTPAGHQGSSLEAGYRGSTQLICRHLTPLSFSFVFQ